MLKAFAEGEYDYGIDHTVIMELTGYNLDDAKRLIKSMTKGDNVVINAASFLAAVIMLSEPNRRVELQQVQLIYDVFDFSLSGQMTLDAFAVMLLCVVSAQGFIIDRSQETPTDAVMIATAKAMFDQLQKSYTSTISQAEVVGLFRDNFSSHAVGTIDKVFLRLCMGPECLSWRVENDAASV
jgi:hypothetical protein